MEGEWDLFLNESSVSDVFKAVLAFKDFCEVPPLQAAFIVFNNFMYKYM